VALRERIHVVPLVALEHIGLEKRVVHDHPARRCQRLASTWRSYLPFCPTFNLAGFSSQSFSRSRTARSSSWAGVPG
jgi:hypothetical protein